MGTSPLKWIESGAKTLGALLASVLWWRPWRQARAVAALGRARRVLLVRLDNRVGEALLMTPLCTTLKRSPNGYTVEVWVHPRVARVLEGHPDIDRVRPFQGLLAGWALRKERYDAVVHCANWTAPSVSGALLARLAAGAAPVVGPARFPVRALADVPVEPLPEVASEVAQRLHLLAPLAPGRAIPTLSFRPRRELSSGSVLSAPGRFAVVNPGGRLGWRRIPPQAFAAAARELVRQGLHPVVTWGPGEEGLAREVVAQAEGSTLAPPTDLDELGGLMAKAALTVCNNTGPMHLSVAVGTPTLALFLRMDLGRWGHGHEPHRMVDLTPEADSLEALEAKVTEEVRRFVTAGHARGVGPGAAS